MCLNPWVVWSLGFRAYGHVEIMEKAVSTLGLCWDDGKEHGNYYLGCRD